MRFWRRNAFLPRGGSLSTLRLERQRPKSRRSAAASAALAVGLAMLGAAACASGPTFTSAVGVQAKPMPDWRLQQAFMPLMTKDMAVFERWGAAVVIAPTIAVTNAHNANLLPKDAILATSRDYDLLFFRTDRIVVPAFGTPRVGEDVIAYGQGFDGGTRQAEGIMLGLSDLVIPRCRNCRSQHALVYDAGAGPGFSGGPVVDAQTGAVVGITFGYRDDDERAKSRLMYAYDMDLVMAEMHALLPRQVLSQNH
jgi:S1-C subfamily serine protease